MEEIMSALVRALEAAPEFTRPERIEGENLIGFETDAGLFFLELQQP